MKTPDEVRSFFENEIKPGLKDLEEWRKKVMIKSIILDSIFGLPFISVVFFSIYFMIRSAIGNKAAISDIVFMIFMMSTMLIVVLMPFVYLWKFILDKSFGIKIPEGESKTLYRTNELLYKNLVIGKLVKFISPDLNYSPEVRQVDGETVLRGEIFPHTVFYPFGYLAEDFVEGVIGNTNIQFFEISGRSAIKPRNPNSDRPGAIDLGGFAYQVFSFHGMLGVVDFNKSFKGHTLVLPETGIRQSQWMLGSGRKKVRLEDPEFESFFSVYGTDQIAARYILSTSLMKRITDYRKKIGRKLSLSFTENRLYVAIRNRKDQFEFSKYRSVYNFDRVKEFFNDLSAITDVVEDLNLNTGIWLKEGEKGSKMFDIALDYKYKKLWVYLTLMYLFGYLGLHYLYIGYKAKALKNFLVTMAIFPLLIWVFFFKNQSDTGPYFVRFIFPIISGMIWYTWIWSKSRWVDRDSRGVEMEY
jgi:hypothetical protein